MAQPAGYPEKTLINWNGVMKMLEWDEGNGYWKYGNGSENEFIITPPGLNPPVGAGTGLPTTITVGSNFVLCARINYDVETPYDACTLVDWAVGAPAISVTPGGWYSSAYGAGEYSAVADSAVFHHRLLARHRHRVSEWGATGDGVDWE